MLLGVPVQVTSDTEFDDSSFDALASDDRVEVDYIVNSDGQRIATEVENEDDQSDSRSSLGLSPLSGPNFNPSGPSETGRFLFLQFVCRNASPGATSDAGPRCRGP